MAEILIRDNRDQPLDIKNHMSDYRDGFVVVIREDGAAWGRAEDPRIPGSDPWFRLLICNGVNVPALLFLVEQLVVPPMPWDDDFLDIDKKIERRRKWRIKTESYTWTDRVATTSGMPLYERVY